MFMVKRTGLTFIELGPAGVVWVGRFGLLGFRKVLVFGVFHSRSGGPLVWAPNSESP